MDIPEVLTKAAQEAEEIVAAARRGVEDARAEAAKTEKDIEGSSIVKEALAFLAEAEAHLGSVGAQVEAAMAAAAPAAVDVATIAGEAAANPVAAAETAVEDAPVIIADAKTAAADIAADVKTDGARVAEDVARVEEVAAPAISHFAVLRDFKAWVNHCLVVFHIGDEIEPVSGAKQHAMGAPVKPILAEAPPPAS